VNFENIEEFKLQCVEDSHSIQLKSLNATLLIMWSFRQESPSIFIGKINCI